MNQNAAKICDVTENDEDDIEEDIEEMQVIKEDEGTDVTRQESMSVPGSFDGEALSEISQDLTPTPDSEPLAPFNSGAPLAYSHVSTVYSPTHTTNSDWSGSDNADRLDYIDEIDAPSPESNDGWKSSASESSTFVSGDSNYWPTPSEMHSDWASEPSMPDFNSPPASPDEIDAPSPESNDGWKSSASESSTFVSGDSNYWPTPSEMHSDWASEPSMPDFNSPPASPDVIDAPSPESNDGWKSSASESSTVVSGDSNYWPTPSEMHSDWSSEPSMPDFNSPPASPDEIDVPSPKSNDGWKSSESESSTIVSGASSDFLLTQMYSDCTFGPSMSDFDSPPITPGDTEPPLEIVVRGEQAVEAYLRAARNGTKKVYRTRIMLVGQERVGKTSLLKSLIGKQHNKKEDITDGVDTTTICKVPIIDCTSPWEVQHTDKTDRVQHAKAQYNKAVGSSMAQELLEMSQDSAGSSYSLDNNQKIESEDKTMGASNDLSQSQSKDRVQHAKAQYNKAVGSSMAQELLEMSQDSAGSSYSLDNNQKIESEDKTMGASNDLSQSPSKVPQEIREEALLELQNKSFQKAKYKEKTEVFLNRRAIFVLVYNASQDLQLSSQVDAVVHGQQKRKSKYYDFTGLDFLHFWLQSVYAYAVDDSKDSNTTTQPYSTPPVFVVGTHRNSLHGNELLDLRKQIAEVALKESYMGEKIPLRWLQFEKALLEAVANSTNYLDIHKVRDLAKKFKINDRLEFSTMLQFYHDLGCIVYFGGDTRGKHNKDLRDIVILDPQWLIDVFKRIITVKQDNKQWPRYCHSWRRLRDEGILEETLIDHVWDDVKEWKATFISLMDMFDLLCPCITQKDTKSGKEIKSYYVPACLQPPCDKAPTDRSDDNNQDGTFYIDFIEFLPDGLFHRILVHISRWSQEESKMLPKLGYRHGKFFLGAQKNRHVVELTMRPSKPACIQVTVKRSPVLNTPLKRHASAREASPHMCSKVQRKLDHVLDIMKQTWIRGITYRFRVACEACNSPAGNPGGDTGQHLLCFYECTHNDIDEIMCTNSGVCMPTEIYKKRFKLAGSSDKEDDPEVENSTNEATPKNGNHNQDVASVIVTEGQISTVAGNMGAEWKSFGLEQLDISKAQIDHCIMNDPQGPVRDHIFNMLHVWKCKSGDSATVTVLVDKLKAHGVNRECYSDLLPTL